MGDPNYQGGRPNPYTQPSQSVDINIHVKHEHDRASMGLEPMSILACSAAAKNIDTGDKTPHSRALLGMPVHIDESIPPNEIRIVKGGEVVYRITNLKVSKG